MKRTILLLTLMWLCAGYLKAQKPMAKIKTKNSAWSTISSQNLLATGDWSTTSTEQKVITEFNGELETQNKQVTISCSKGKFDFDIAGDKQNSFSVNASYDKTELGIVYFVPKAKVYSRITIHRKDKLIVVEYADRSTTAIAYDQIVFTN